MPRQLIKNIPQQLKKREIHLRCVCNEEEAERIRERAKKMRMSVSRMLLELADPQNIST